MDGLLYNLGKATEAGDADGDALAACAASSLLVASQVYTDFQL